MAALESFSPTGWHAKSSHFDYFFLRSLTLCLSVRFTLLLLGSHYFVSVSHRKFRMLPLFQFQIGISKCTCAATAPWVGLVPDQLLPEALQLASVKIGLITETIYVLLTIDITDSADGT